MIMRNLLINKDDYKRLWEKECKDFCRVINDVIPAPHVYQYGDSELTFNREGGVNWGYPIVQSFQTLNSGKIIAHTIAVCSVHQDVVSCFIHGYDICTREFITENIERLTYGSLYSLVNAMDERKIKH